MNTRNIVGNVPEPDELYGRTDLIDHLWRQIQGNNILLLAPSERNFNEPMADLQCEWYLVLNPRTNEYYFMVNVMRDWWQRWYGSPRKKQPSEKEK